VNTRSSAPIQTGPGAHPVLYTIGTESLSQGVRGPERGVNHPPPPSAEVKQRLQLFLYFPSGSSCFFLGKYFVVVVVIIIIIIIIIIILLQNRKGLKLVTCPV
jgi:hypothetical protein